MTRDTVHKKIKFIVNVAKIKKIIEILKHEICFFS